MVIEIDRNLIILLVKLFFETRWSTSAINYYENIKRCTCVFIRINHFEILSASLLCAFIGVSYIDGEGILDRCCDLLLAVVITLVLYAVDSEITIAKGFEATERKTNSIIIHRNNNGPVNMNDFLFPVCVCSLLCRIIFCIRGIRGKWKLLFSILS